jgi:hypothetical protein
MLPSSPLLSLLLLQPLSASNNPDVRNPSLADELNVMSDASYVVRERVRFCGE